MSVLSLIMTSTHGGGEGAVEDCSATFTFSVILVFQTKLFPTRHAPPSLNTERTTGWVDGWVGEWVGG